jgi:glycosyltransferase involved in cell wall biosynthesis
VIAKRIFIEGMGLVDDHFSGVGQYILGILRGLDELAERAATSGDAMPDIVVVIPRGTSAKFASFGFRHIRHRALPTTFHRTSKLWRKGRMFPIDLWCGRGVYIFPRFVDMPLAFSRSAVVVYDLSYERFPEYSDERNAAFLSEGVRRSVRRAGRVIAISDHAKGEIMQFYGLPADRVVVATPAVDTGRMHRATDEEIAAAKRRYGIEGEYLLALSNLEPRKNVEGLVDAYCALPAGTRERLSLLLVGEMGWRSEALQQKIQDRVAGGYRIVRPSRYVSDADKPAIISGATLLVYPSHYEGFGIPPLEALACSVPVITSDNSSLPQAGGGLAIMVDSRDTTALREAIVGALDDYPSLSERIRRDGSAHAARFSWTASAQVFLDAAESLAR